MKNTEINVRSFAMAKLKAKINISLLILIFAVVGFLMAALSLTGCGGGSGGGVTLVEEQWGWVWDDTSTAKATIDVDADGVCTITVTGTTETVGNRWKTQIAYEYSQRQGVSYVYIFEAWTQTGTRDLEVKYFENNADNVHLANTIQITDERKTYTVYGEALPRLGEGPAIRFGCADKLGTFYIKITKIEEYTAGKLTITNFSGAHGLTQNSYLEGSTEQDSDGIGLAFGSIVQRQTWDWSEDPDEIHMVPKEVKITGNTINISVWEVNYNEKTFAPFKGTITIPAGCLQLEQSNYASNGDWTGNDYYVNTVPITFTNGNASINFGTQMEWVYSYDSATESQITITGITGKTGLVFIGIYSSISDMVISGISLDATLAGDGIISGNSVQINLAKMHGRYTPFTVGDSYYLVLGGDNGDYVYTNGQTFDSLGITSRDDLHDDSKLPKCNITSMPFSIDFSKFQEVTENSWKW